MSTTHASKTRIVHLTAALIALMALVSGCSLLGEDTPNPHAGPPVALIVTARANQPAVLTDHGTPVGNVIDDLVADQSTVTVIRTDGSPTVVATVNLQNTANSGARTNYAAMLRNKLAKAITTSTATAPEADQITALALAARSTGGRGRVVVVDTGLMTAPPIRMQQGVLSPDTNTADLMQALTSAGALPNLTGVNITWIGMGDTARPQPELDLAARARLQGFWKNLLIKAGANVTFNSAVVPDAPTRTGLPPVTPVDVTKVDPGLTIELGATTLDFHEGTAEFADQTRAENTLAGLATSLDNGGYRHLHITGTTARWGSTSYQIDLSTQRAEQTARTLARLGYQGTITTEGLGSQFPEYVPDHEADGTLDPVRAQQNRLVIIQATK